MALDRLLMGQRIRNIREKYLRKQEKNLQTDVV